MNLLHQVSGHNTHRYNEISGPKTTDSPTICSVKIPLTEFIHGWCWCTSFPLLWYSFVKSLTHRRDSSPFGSLSKRWMDTGIKSEERGDGKEKESGRKWRKSAAVRFLHFLQLSSCWGSQPSRYLVVTLLTLIPPQKPHRHAANSLYYVVEWKQEQLRNLV